MLLFQLFTFFLYTTQSSSVQERELTTLHPTSFSILDNAANYSTKTSHLKITSGIPTLAFVTPWNSHGYDIPKLFPSKFTIISPVWFYIKPGNMIEGDHDVDKEWVKTLQDSGILLMPRFAISEFANDDYMALIQSSESQLDLSRKIAKVCKKYSFDGVVLELSAPSYMLNVVSLISKELKKDGKKVILVIAPIRGNQQDFTGEHYDQFFDHVDYFALMTYDYSNPGSPGI
jgi:chitinase domain-containing protein 1